MRRTVWFGILFLLAHFPVFSAEEARIVMVHEGKHWIWFAREDQFAQFKQDIEPFYEYADKAFEYLCEAWGLKPPKDKYALFVWTRTGGGFATGDIGEVHSVTGKISPGIGVSYDAFFNVANGIKGYWGYVLITHEMVNLFTGQIVSGGWPVDWWADHRSPFPLMTAVQIEFALIPEVAIHHAQQMKEDPLCLMFWKLKDQFGWYLFRKAFQTAKEDGINWDRIGQNPSKLRTNYVCAYLQLSAPTNLSPYFKDIVPNYDEKMTADIMKAWRKWHSLSPDSKERAKLKDLFLKGEYEKCLR
ncbi:hypothetical protein H5T87_09375 [bacterium]|nr:hypothetical protein [bacterium]